MDNTGDVRRWRAGAIITGIIAAIAIAALVFWGSIGFPTPTANLPEPTPTSTPEVQVDPKEDLSVKPGDLVPACASDKFIRNSLNTAPLEMSDAVSTAFVSTDPAAMFTEYLGENCGNPTVLDQTIKGLATIVLDDGSTVYDVNKVWMDEYYALTTTAVDGKVPTLRELFLTKKSGEGNALFVTQKFQEFSGLANYLMMRLHNEGVFNDQSLTNFHVPSREGMKAGELPVPQLNTQYQEKLKDLRLTYSLKSGGCEFAIGLNILDKRWETIASCAPTTTQSDCSVTGTCPAGNPDCTTTGTCPTTCPYGKDWRGNCIKGAADDPPAPPLVTPQPLDSPEPIKPAAPATPAPVLPAGPAPTSTTPAAESTPAPVSTAAPVIPQAPEAGTTVIIP